jgi:hypothetical protein
MNLPATHQALAAAHSRCRAAALRHSKKSSYSNTFGDNSQGSEASWDGLSSLPRQLGSYQSGTTQSAPLWNGLCLQPAFVAQVLGQVMYEGGPQAADRIVLAYRRSVAPVPAALHLDRSV